MTSQVVLMKRWQIPQVLQNQAVSPISAASIYFKDILHFKDREILSHFPLHSHHPLSLLRSLVQVR